MNQPSTATTDEQQQVGAAAIAMLGMAGLCGWEWLEGTRELLVHGNLVRIRGRHPASLMQLLDQVLEPDRLELQARIRASCGKPLRCEYRVELPGGSTRWVRGILLRRQHPGQDSVLAVEEDIQDERDAQAALVAQVHLQQESSAQKDQFFSILSHDLREPLRMVTGFLGLLQRRAGELDERQREFLNHANDGARRLVLMLESLLRYGRTGRGRAPRLTSLEQALETARARLEERCAGIPATWSVGALPEVMADPEQLVDLLVELLANALVFHAGERAEIAVEAVRGDACWILAVSDRGIGIPQQERSRVLEVFCRLNAREAYPGCGMGLAIASRIAQQHGGKLWISAGPDGVGTCVHVSLPDHGTSA